MKITTVLFDLDGTLTDSGPGIMNSVKYALEKAGGRYQRQMNCVNLSVLRSKASLWNIVE